MDLQNWWPENKRFSIVTVSGVIVFLIGTTLVSKYFGNELTRQLRAAESAARKLKTEKMFMQKDLDAAEAENKALVAAVQTLTTAVGWTSRPEFVLDSKRGSPSNQYFATVAATREELLKVTGRGSLRVPEDLGLPALSPTREPEIVRYLEALDLVDRAVRLALAAGCERIDKIEIKLAPKAVSQKGATAIERTRVEFTLSGKPAPLVAFLSLTQTADKQLGALLVEKSDMQPARNKSDEAGLETTFVIAHLAP